MIWRDRLKAPLLMIIAASCAGTPRTTTVSDASCSAPLREPSVTLELPNNPFQALPTADGCWILVSLPGGAAPPRGIAVVRRTDGRLVLDHVLPLQQGATGMALTHDQRTLIVADGDHVAFVDVAKLVRGDGSALLGYLDEPTRPLGRIYVNTTADDKFAFVADEGAATITVIDLAKARDSRYAPTSIVGKIPTGNAPIALSFSPDGRWLYTTSQSAPRSLGWPIECKRENSPDTTSVNPQGAVLVVDVAVAKRDPASSVVRAVPAGCNPVRLVLSPAGDRAYVTARGNNALLVFDAAKLTTDARAARIAAVPVGTSPVGVAVIDNGRKLVVTNSNRFGGGANDRQMLTVIDASRVGEGRAAIIGSIPAGAFPRELRVTADGRTLVLTNFGSRTLQVIDLQRLDRVMTR